MLMTVGRLPKHRICLQCLIYIFLDNATLEQVIVSSHFFYFTCHILVDYSHKRHTFYYCITCLKHLFVVK